ncbi:conserved hypothetical protein [uncultured Desulfobacterium sp.]|uniref:DUF2786 domain-containing protein n=1 Tax=uncultured Desulfobacterium sp. TaxID=201089 RepID=A0A445N0Z5_9BACT|nr:conserved hypothetical protein [uncultured Desulfobacterium sp.]
MAHQKPSHIAVEEDLCRRILHGLACEWENAIWVLESSLRLAIKRPIFSICDMKGRWGSWSCEKNEISISKDLVLNHSWDAVREILLHEMAHQLTEQLLDGRLEPPHGPKFKKACHLLRANPKASGNYALLDQRISAYTSEDKILIRVKKLIALAQSQNRFEAEAAMLKAHELILKYNVELIESHDNHDIITVFVGTPALRHFREDYHLAGLLQDFYFVYGIWVPSYVLEKGNMGRVLEISGTGSNVRIACYVYDFIRRFISSQWTEYNRKRRLNRFRMTDFAVGIIEGFRSKLNQDVSSKIKSHNTKCMTVILDAKLKEHIHYKYPRVSTVRGRAIRNDKSVLKDGISAGKELVIHKGIVHRNTEIRLLN